MLPPLDKTLWAVDKSAGSEADIMLARITSTVVTLITISCFLSHHPLPQFQRLSSRLLHGLICHCAQKGLIIENVKSGDSEDQFRLHGDFFFFFLWWNKQKLDRDVLSIRHVALHLSPLAPDACNLCKADLRSSIRHLSFATILGDCGRFSSYNPLHISTPALMQMNMVQSHSILC